MKGYMLYCKDAQNFLDALNILREENLKYDVNLESSCIYFNQIEIMNVSDECMKKLLVPRHRYLRELESVVKLDGTVTYSNQSVKTGTSGLLQKIKNCTNISVLPGFTYYPTRKSIWVRSSGFYKIKDIEKSKNKNSYDSTVIDFYNLLKKLTSSIT